MNNNANVNEKIEAILFSAKAEAAKIQEEAFFKAIQLQEEASAKGRQILLEATKKCEALLAEAEAAKAKEKNVHYFDIKCMLFNTQFKHFRVRCEDALWEKFKTLPNFEKSTLVVEGVETISCSSSHEINPNASIDVDIEAIKKEDLLDGIKFFHTAEETVDEISKFIKAAYMLG